MLRFFVDSDCDISLEMANSYGADFISMPYEVNGELVYPYKDWKVFDDKKFYKMLRDGIIPTTSALNEAEYEAIFEPVFAGGDDIIYIHFSRKMSASFDNMDKAVANLLKKYPERKFYDADTKGITINSMIQVLEALDMYKAGKAPEEIVAAVEKEAPYFATYFFADDLKFFRKSGRVSGIAGILGNLIGIKPIINMSDEGKMVNVGKVKGTKNGIKELLNIFDTLKAPDFKDHRIIVASCDAEQIARQIEAELKAKYGNDLNIIYTHVNPTIGSHCGPDTVGIGFHAIHR